MSHFYGTLRGSRVEATRCGTKNSGIIVEAASWDGCVRISIRHNKETGKDEFHVMQTLWHGSGVSEKIASGIVGERKPNPQWGESE